MQPIGGAQIGDVGCIVRRIVPSLQFNEIGLLYLLFGWLKSVYFGALEIMPFAALRANRSKSSSVCENEHRRDELCYNGYKYKDKHNHMAETTFREVKVCLLGVSL